MRKPRGSFAYTVLQGFAWLVIASIIVLLVLTGLFVTPWHQSGQYIPIVSGKADISSRVLSREPPYYLDGQWEYYPGVYLEDYASFDPQKLPSGKHMQLPITTISEAQGPATYRLFLKVSPGLSPGDIAFYIPNAHDDIHLFFNGQLQDHTLSSSGWVGHNSLDSIFNPQALDSSTTYQELVISVNPDAQDTAMYKRSVLVGAPYNMITLINTTIANEMLALGIMLVIMLTGFVFMVFRPNHLMISLLTLFEFTVIMRIIFGLSNMLDLFQSFFPFLQFSDQQCFSASIFFLMLGGAAGSSLSHIIFDPTNQVPRWLIQPVPICYFVFAVVFAAFPAIYEGLGLPLLLLLYLFTFIGVFMQFCVCWRTNKSPYYAVQIVKSTYIGVVILLDILTMQSRTSFMLLVYLYGIFFIIHIILRLYDNNSSYKEVELLNRDLENTVAERTRRLSELNRTLEELAIRDPLTKAYNRIYLEQQLEKRLAQAALGDSTLYLCILDLDFFKSVNDNYGHGVGDEQLRYVVSLINKLMVGDAMLSRVGGEEFVILFAHQTYSQVMDNLEQIRYELQQQARENLQFTTASFGLTGYLPGDTMKIILQRADKCLYQAKDSGRNRIVSDAE